jgi:small GTP-binding protein
VPISKKICLLGDFAVGKTSLVRRFVHDLFDDKYISTIGVKVSRKTVMLPGERHGLELTMMLWDLAGSEEFNLVQASYLRGASGALLVCDLTRTETLDGLLAYAKNMLEVSPSARFALAANKCDLVDQQQLTREDVEQVATHLDAPFCLTSAKTGDDVEMIFSHLGQLVLGPNQ